MESVPQKTCGWYKGPTFVEILDTIGIPNRDANGPLRIPVLDKMRERGVVCFGKVESGTVRMGDKLTVMPNNISC